MPKQVEDPSVQVFTGILTPVKAENKLTVTNAAMPPKTERNKHLKNLPSLKQNTKYKIKYIDIIIINDILTKSKLIPPLALLFICYYFMLYVLELVQ